MRISFIEVPPVGTTRFMSMGYGGGRIPTDDRGNMVTGNWKYIIRFKWSDGGITEKEFMFKSSAAKALRIYSSNVMDDAAKELVKYFS